MDEHRFQRLESKQTEHEKSITMLSVAIEKMGETQEKIESTLEKISDAISDIKYLQKKLDEIDAAQKIRAEKGCLLAQDVDKRVSRIEAGAWKIISAILGAVGLAVLGLVVK